MYPPFNGAAPPPGYYYGDPDFYEKQREKRKIAYRGGGVGLALIATQLLPYLYSAFAAPLLVALGLMNPSAIIDEFSGMQPLTYYIYYAALYIMMFTVPYLLLMLCFRLRFRQVLPFRKTSRPGLMVLAGVGGLTMCMASNELAARYTATLQSIGIPVDMPPFPKDGSLVSEICLFVIIAILPAFLEEFAFRGVVLQMLLPYGEVFAVVGSAFAFGVMHANIQQIPFAFAGGLFFGYIAVRTGSIWPSILMHFLNNSLSYVQELILDHTQDFLYEQTSTVLLYASYLAMALLGLICLAVLLRRDRDFFRTNPDPLHRLNDKEKLAKFVGNPGMITALVVIGIVMIVEIVQMGMIA